jgi:ribosomal protein S18 acetylase RimI-like enzyme
MIEVRTLTLDDYDAIMAVWQASGLKIKPTGRESREAMQQQMDVGIQTIVGAFVDGQLAGVVLATHDSRKGWVNRLGVAEAFKRRGVGRALVQAAENCLHDQGITVIGALVEHTNEASRTLFEGEGFEVVPSYYLAKRDRPDA